jgi:hypothetical protein
MEITSKQLLARARARARQDRLEAAKQEKTIPFQVRVVPRREYETGVSAASKRRILARLMRRIGAEKLQPESWGSLKKRKSD